MLIRNLFAAVLPALMLAGPPLACAQGYPSRAITVIVPFPPGAGSDTLMRIVGQKSAESPGQQLVIENRPGGGAATGAVAAKQATPDGYVLMQINLGSHAANTVLGIQPLTSSPTEFAAMIQSRIARLGKLVKELGAKGD